MEHYPMETDKPRRGRPPVEETPESLIRRELIAHLKLYRTLREIVQKKVSEGGENMDAEALAKYMELLRKGIVEMAKPIVPVAPKGYGPAEAEEDPQKILENLLSQKEDRR